TCGTEKGEMARVVLYLAHGIVVLLFRDHELPSIRRRVLLRFWMAHLLEIAQGGIARFKEKTSLREQMFPHARQHRFLVLSRQKELKDMPQHVNEWKLPLEIERARIGYYPLNGDCTLRGFLARLRDHFRCDVHTRDLVALRGHAQGQASRSTRQV